MKYEGPRATGTRAELIDHITKSALAPGRSDRRMQEAAKAVTQLGDDYDEVTYGGITYVVTDDQ